MNILFDLGHPAHVHLFRKAAQTLKEQGHGVHISIRDRKIIKDLLDLYGFSYLLASAGKSTAYADGKD